MKSKKLTKQKILKSTQFYEMIYWSYLKLFLNAYLSFQLALSSTSALTVPSPNATLQLSTQVSEQLDEAAAAVGTTTTTTPNSNNTSSSHRPLSGNNKEFKQEINRRLQRDYPWLYVLISSLVVLLLASLNIYIERLQTDRFELDDFDVLSYRTLSGLALLGAALNIFFALLAILTSQLI